MTRTSRSLFPVLLVLLFAAAAPLAAQSANGSFTFSFDGTTRSVDFNAKAFGSGARGEMTFTGVVSLPDDDVDGEGPGGGSTTTTNLTMKVDFDCLVVGGTRASMSGLVTESSVPGYIGRRSLLVVEDGGEGVKSAGDSFTWGLYRRAANWTPSDAELEFDNGASLSWFATDAERIDDVGVQVGNGSSREAGDCRAVALGAYAVEELVHGNGNIQVRP